MTTGYASDISPRVSVIIPLGNAERTIGRTLRSVQAQTIRAIEIIVVDDGSTDRGPELVRAAMASDPRITIHSQPNSGVATARNTGIKLARADFVAPVDADDLWTPQKLEWQLRAFEGAPNVGLVYCFFDAIDADDRLLWPGARRQVEGRALEALLREDFIGNGSNAMMRRDLLLDVGGYDPLLREQGAQGGEDWQVGLKLAERCEFACVPDVMVGYRRMRGNMSGNAAQMLRSAQLVAEPFRKAYPQYAPAIDAHVEERRRWLFARAMGDLNVPGLMAISRDVGGFAPAFRSALSVARPVLREIISAAMRRLGLRRQSGFFARG